MMHELALYKQLIVECLVRYAGFDQQDAEQRVAQSTLFRDESALDIVLHEEPYFWAMELAHGRSDPNNYWFHDSRLWPPPPEIDAWVTKRYRELSAGANG
jgi:hypothetical protein